MRDFCFTYNEGKVKRMGIADIKIMKEKRDVEGLINLLECEDDYYLRSEVAKALGEVGDRRSVDALIKALEDIAGVVRIEAAIALGKIRDGKAADHLVQSLDSKYDTLKFEAAKALEKLGWQPKNNNEKVKQLIAKGPKLFTEKQWEDVRASNEEVQGLFIKVLNTGNWFERWQAAEVLGEINNETAYKALNEALKSEKNDTVRSYMKKALEKIESKR
jgi:HEAT repeat protein